MRTPSNASAATWLLIVLALVWPKLTTASPLTVRLDGAAPNTPLELALDPSDLTPLEVTVLLANDSEVPSDAMWSWQVGLHVSPAGSTVGELLFQSFAASSGSIFDEGSGLMQLGELPPQYLILTDVDVSEEFLGKSLEPGAEFPIFSFQLAAIGGTEGEFVLSLIPFDEMESFETSFWARAGDGTPLPFNNESVTTSALELAIVHVGSTTTTLDGDFNLDRVVDAADYTVWRDNLGNDYDPEDYEIWKSHFGDTANTGIGASVPEPALALTAVSLAFPIAVFRLPRRR